MLQKKLLIAVIGLLFPLTNCTSIQVTQKPVSQIRLPSQAISDSVFQPLNFSADVAPLIEEHRQFLMNLGFEDFGLEAKKNREKENLGLVAQSVLKQNSSRFDIISYSREMGVIARAGLHFAEKNNRLAQAIDSLTRLTAYHLMPFSLNGLQPVPPNIKSNKVGEEYLAVREQYMISQATERSQKEKLAIVATIVELIFAGEHVSSETIGHLDEFAESLIEDQYFVSGLQQNRYLGRALAATLVRYSRENQKPAIENHLAALLAEEGVFLGNHISSVQKYKDYKGKVHLIQVYNGDTIGEYSSLSEAYQITIGVSPAKENRKYAREMDVIGSKFLFPLKNFDKPTKEAIKRSRENYPAQKGDKALLDGIFNPLLNQGFSHVGFVELRKDKNFGIEMIWVWDIYPYSKLGGVRFQTPENFAYPERYNRIGYTHYSPIKALEVFKRLYKERGFQTSAWESDKLINIDEDNILIGDKSKTYNWPINMDRATVERWSKLDSSQAEAWYYNEIVPRAHKMARKFLVDKEALAFADGFKNIEASAYCSLFVYLSFMQGAHFDMQAHPDDWAGFVKVLTMMGKKDYEIRKRVISPNGFAWQKDLSEATKFVDFDRSKVYEQRDNHPAINGKPTQIDRRLQILSPMLNGIGKKISEQVTPLEQLEYFDFDDDNL